MLHAMFTIVLKKRAAKQHRKLPKDDQERILLGLKNLQFNPYTGKKLDGEYEGLWSLRVWPYRIIYTIDKHIITVTVVAIGDRKDVYRRLRR